MRSRSERLEGSSCFFLRVLATDAELKKFKTNLNWTSAPSVETPVVIQIETDKPENCQIEEDLPSGHYAPMAI